MIRLRRLNFAPLLLLVVEAADIVDDVERRDRSIVAVDV